LPRLRMAPLSPEKKWLW